MEKNPTDAKGFPIYLSDALLKEDPFRGICEKCGSEDGNLTFASEFLCYRCIISRPMSAYE
jgi:hypothetical protein